MYEEGDIVQIKTAKDYDDCLEGSALAYYGGSVCRVNEVTHSGYYHLTPIDECHNGHYDEVYNNHSIEFFDWSSRMLKPYISECIHDRAHHTA